MPQLERYRPDEVRIRVKQLDSTGRTREQIEAMEKNAYRTPRLGAQDQALADMIADHQSEFPKVMFRLALRNGKPAGDEMAPSYPLPFDLAQMLGIPEGQFKVIGKTLTSGGYLILRHPYQTILVGVVNSDQTVDVMASRKQEKELLAKGWVHNLEDVKGLPKSLTDDTFDPLPVDK